jgi:cobyrinic acid a,c-diamide synthase
MIVESPRVVFSALRGNSGKTFLTVGVGACLRQRGKAVSPFKKGPDYIDAAWLEMATGHPCYNLDLFLMGKEGILSSFSSRVRQTDGALVEGNRGLYDGMDQVGTYSTAELAKLLQAPVVLVVDCSMATRTVAAMILGCQHFDPGVPIKGVILNRIAGARHESIIRSAIEDRCGLPVLGAVPRIEGEIFPERHMGLVPPREHPGAQRGIAEAARIVDRYVDVDRLWEVAQGAPAVSFDAEPEGKRKERGVRPSRQPKIGFIRDSAFWFYYPDNLEVLEKLGASLVECSALNDRELPSLDALYIGGGFPESHAAALAANEGFRNSVREAAEAGLPIYAECGGLMYLGKEILVEGKTFPMAGVFPLRFVLDRRPQGHGYTILDVDALNPYFPFGETLHGHEFHYSHIPEWEEGPFTLVFKVKRGQGIHGGRDGLLYKNVLATYSHVHASGAKGWARALLERAVYYQKNVSSEQTIAVDEVPVATEISRTTGHSFLPGHMSLV